MPAHSCSRNKRSSEYPASGMRSEPGTSEDEAGLLLLDSEARLSVIKLIPTLREPQIKSYRFLVQKIYHYL
jgi:hypothetical protein